MPHCHIEHSAQLNGQQLMHMVHEDALASGLFEADGADIKVRAQPYINGLVGGQPADFVHVTLRILAGRNHAQKAALTNSVLESLCAYCAPDCAVSVEVVEIDPHSYRKASHTLGEPI